MKRDMDIIRALLMQVESGEIPEALKGVSEEVKVYHIALLSDANLIHARIVEDEQGNPFNAVIFRLTWDGHEFLDAARNDTTWNHIKSKILKPGVSWTASILFDILKAEAQRILQHAIGTHPAQ